MTSSEIRQSFFDFFESKGHKIVPSAPLLPSSPNLLFTNAGMNQFVPYFLGERKATDQRVANSQKCIRAGGKHNDLEDVGFDTYHQTFFEMLGNWSFGDYFKEEAIEWAWELLTEVWKFPKRRLYATVYKPGPNDPAEVDREAQHYWTRIFQREGMDPAVHLTFAGKQDNFWMMGDSGPCGPCSEIHMDLTENGDTRGSLVNKGSPYCIEIWNLVFIQFNASPLGGFEPLAQKHVDTGMGFERVCGIMATTKHFTQFTEPPSNYNGDLFLETFAKLSHLCGKQYKSTVPKSAENLSKQESVDVAFRVIADHIRTLSCAIADGILPGNEGRNYVLRRILRRAVVFGNQLDLKPGFFAKLFPCVLAKLGRVFPELGSRVGPISKVIRSEEEAFGKTLNRGLALLNKITQTGSKRISGADAFTLYDTYGFPLDLTQLIARERGLTVDLEGFDRNMREQKKRSQDAQRKAIIKIASSRQADPTEFVGYELENLKNYPTVVSEILGGRKNTYVVFRQTPFFGERGGQVGDTGRVRVGTNSIKLTDTVHDDAGRILHEIEAGADLIIGDSVELSVDYERRLAIQRNHSATHLLHYALRRVLGPHVTQAGSLVSPTRLRFDFNHYEAVSERQIREIDRMVNWRIRQNSPVNDYEVPFHEKPEQVIAQFGEKYGDIVRVVDIGKYSLELCGGTHTKATGEIGFFKIVSESAIASGTRRIEAITGRASQDYVEVQFNTLAKLSHKLSCAPNEVGERVDALLSEKSSLEKAFKKLRQKDSARLAADLARAGEERNGLKWLVRKVQTPSPQEMRQLAVQISRALGEGVVILGGVFAKKVVVLALCTPAAIAAGVKAVDLVQSISGKLGGTGGGKADFAMGGGKNTALLETVLKDAKP